MGNGKGLVSGKKLSISIDGTPLTYADIEAASAQVVANYGAPTTIIFPSPLYSSNYGFRIRVAFQGISAPAGEFLYAAEAFGLITWEQAQSASNDYSSRLYHRHMKKLQRLKGTKKKWTREFRNDKFKR